MVFLSMFVFFESFERFYAVHEPDHGGGPLLALAIMHVLLALIGSLFFRRALTSRAAKESRYPRDDLLPLPLAVFGECLPCAALFSSYWALHLRQRAFGVVDCIGALAVVIALLYLEALPACFESGRLLLQTTPASLRDALDKCVREAATVDGVLEITQEHFWTHAPGIFVGTLTVRARSDADEQQVLTKLTHIFSHLITHLTIQVEKDEWPAVVSSK